MDSMTNDNFLFCKSWLELTEKYYEGDENKIASLNLAINRYGIYGKKTFPCEPMFLDQVYAQIDSAKDKWTKRVEAGRKGGKLSHGGGAPIGNQNARKNNKQTTSKQQHKDNDNENENDIIIINDNDISPSPNALGGVGSEIKKEDDYELEPFEQKVFEGGFLSGKEAMRRFKEGTLFDE